MSEAEPTTPTAPPPPAAETTPPTLLSQPETPPSSEKTEPPKPEGEKAPEAKPGEKPPVAGAPEKYADFKLPEGQKLDATALAEALPIFKELGLSQDAAQRLVDLQAKFAGTAAEAASKSYWDMRAGWQKEAKALPEIGTELGQGKKVNVTISKAIDQIGNPALAKEFKAAMDLTGAGDHPAFIQVLYHFAKQLAEGGAVRGNGPVAVPKPGEGRKSAAAEIYPNLPSGTGA